MTLTKSIFIWKVELFFFLPFSRGNGGGACSTFPFCPWMRDEQWKAYEESVRRCSIMECISHITGIAFLSVATGPELFARWQQEVVRSSKKTPSCVEYPALRSLPWWDVGRIETLMRCENIRVRRLRKLERGRGCVIYWKQRDKSPSSGRHATSHWGKGKTREIEKK